MEDNRLFELLLEKKLLSPPQLMNAKNLQKQTGGTLRQLIVKLNYVKAGELNNLIATAEGLHSVEVKVENIHLEAIKKIPQKTIDKYCVLPLQGEEKKTILLAMADPNNYQAIEEIQFLTGWKVDAALAPQEDISKAINYYYNHREELENKIKEKDIISTLEKAPSLEADLDGLFQSHNQKEVFKAFLRVCFEKNLLTLGDIREQLE